VKDGFAHVSSVLGSALSQVCPVLRGLQTHHFHGATLRGSLNITI